MARAAATVARGVDASRPARPSRRRSGRACPARSPGRARSSRPGDRSRAMHQDLAAAVVERGAAARGRSSGASGVGPSTVAGIDGVDLGQAQASFGERVAQRRALREADAELRALVTRSGRSRRGSSARRCRAAGRRGRRCSRGSAPCRSTRAAGRRRVVAAWRGGPAGTSVSGERRSSMLLLGHAGRPSCALLGMVFRARGVPPAGLVRAGRSRGRDRR